MRSRPRVARKPSGIAGNRQREESRLTALTGLYRGARSEPAGAHRPNGEDAEDGAAWRAGVRQRDG
jgi:hypothetical protein